MFEFNPKLSRLDIPAQKVLRLKRSLGDVQIALPGQKSQLATAYVCAFSSGKGVRVAIAIHLHDEYKLVYYLNSGGEVGSNNAGSVLNQAVDFSESLGFMMSDLDIHKLEGDEKKTFWEGLPLVNPPAKPQPAAPQAAEPQAAAKAEVVRKVVAEPEAIEEVEELSAEESVELDLGLPRRKLTSPAKKKERPSPAELEEKRDRLRENLGRFLSSL